MRRAEDCPPYPVDRPAARQPPDQRVAEPQRRLFHVRCYGPATIESRCRIPTRLRQGYGGQAAPSSKFMQERFDAAELPDPGVALPLNLRDFASGDINFERPEAADAALPSLHGNFIMSGRHQSPEMSVVIGGK